MLELNETYSAAAAASNLSIGPTDDIDKALAEFIINEWPDGSMQRPVFQRESYGVYYCGKKKLHLKFGKGKQLMVRVGNGMVSIRDFITNSK